MFVDRFLHTAMTYPCNYGFIPHTLAADGDPTDVLVAGRVPVVPGARGAGCPWCRGRWCAPGRSAFS
jgi:inorganic pyrophosphatase